MDLATLLGGSIIAMRASSIFLHCLKFMGQVSESSFDVLSIISCQIQDTRARWLEQDSFQFSKYEMTGR